MSENKYIIDKDSLTGIADVVRDKLGAGEATTDETTGEIVYPKDKGYYIKQGKLAGFIYPSTSASHYSYTEIMSVPHETILELCGNINPSFIKFTVLTKGDGRASYSAASRTLYNGVYFYSGEITNSATLLNNVVGATRTFAYTGQGCYITGETGYYSAGGWNPATYSYYSYPGSLQIEFLNENQQNIEAAIDGPIAGTSRYTMEIPNGEVPTKIPFSIDDIQNKIANYLIKGDSVKSAMFFLNDSANDNEHTSSVYYSGGWFINLNGSYASNALSKLRPENIQYILSYSPGSSSGTNYYQYDPKIKALQHYTSFSLSESGYPPRISGVTDYYFLTNATKHYVSWTFGLACFDNGTDLDFQIVQKSSGSTLEGQLKASRFTTFQPTVFFIIYKEATE